MSLDITILDLEGYPEKQVGIEVEDHYRLMQLVIKNPNSLFFRINDYYSDAEFKNNELDLLVKEAKILQTQCSNDKKLAVFLNTLIDLAKTAKQSHRSLTVISD